MPADVYSVIAAAARYWFLFLAALMVLRSFIWLRRDNRARYKRIRRLPNAGSVGEFVVLSGGDQLPNGMILPFPREGTLGSLRVCDVVVPADGVAGKHASFMFIRGKGLTVEPYYNQPVTVDGALITRRKHALIMLHGSVLQIGSVTLRARFYMGVDVPIRGPAPSNEAEIPYQSAGAYAPVTGVPRAAEDGTEPYEEERLYDLSYHLTADPSDNTDWDMITDEPAGSGWGETNDPYAYGWDPLGDDTADDSQ